MDTKWLNPTFSWKLQSRIAVHKAPLWLINPTLPGRAIDEAKVAFRPETGLITPRQLGPMMRIFPRWASANISLSRAAPFSPISLNPADMTIAPFTPLSTHWRITPGTVGAGVTITARSTSSGTSSTVGYALMPRTFTRFRFTGKIVPPNELVMRFQSMVLPTLPSRSVAPITATLRGEKIGSSGWWA